MKKFMLTLGLVAFVGLAGFAQRDAQTRSNDGGNVGITPVEKVKVEEKATKESCGDQKEAEKAGCSKSCSKSCSDKKAEGSTERTAPATRETAAPATREAAPATRERAAVAPATREAAPATREAAPVRERKAE
jgi:hypothetical protein